MPALPSRLLHALLCTSAIAATTLATPLTAIAQFRESSRTAQSCRLSSQAIVEKETLRQAAQQGSAEAAADYQRLVAQHARDLDTCRQANWPRHQALWLRLYPCDAQPGVLDEVLDRIVSRGYNEVYIEVFYDGQVLLPASDNPTPWQSVLRTPELANTDLLADAIRKGRERGLKVYAWLFTLNFGYAYGQLDHRNDALARNGAGETTLTRERRADASIDSSLHSYASQAFVDPYSPLARRDYEWLLYAVLQRQPDGVLFDYVRYPRLPGADSVADNVRDLWIFGDAARNALLDRANNPSARDLLERYLQQGYLTENDRQAVRRRYPNEERPQWQTVRGRGGSLQDQLWTLSVAHAVQGILDFVALAVEQVSAENLPSGAVFFPNGNRPIGEGYDSRLQPWDRFPATMEWHPMIYGVCGDTSCITEELERVLDFADPETRLVPAIAGVWGEPVSNRPSLEAQMSALRQVAPQLDAVSHFAYSWQFPESDRERKFCSESP